MPSFLSEVLQRQIPLTTTDHFASSNSAVTGLVSLSPSLAAENIAFPSCGEAIRTDNSKKVNRHSHNSNASLPCVSGIDEKESIPPFNYNTAPRISGGKNAITGVSSLPYIQDCRRRDGYPYQRKPAPSVFEPKEEKVVGGVAAYLDYEIEQMADFVTEMAQGMYALYESRICLADIDIIRSVNPNSLVPLALRKFVLQVLSSTRLPSTTILLGLYYLATRMTMLSAGGKYKSGSGQVHRMLITSLLLGSKFLDDNTFQNRSWSDVSNIPISELNLLETEWLLAVKWDMHISLNDPHGFILWLGHWDKWRFRRNKIAMESLKLITLDTIVSKQESITSQQPSLQRYCSPHTGTSSGAASENEIHSQWRNTYYDQWPISLPKMDNSPPSAPESGPNTPEWYAHIEGALVNGVRSQPYRTRPDDLSLQMPMKNIQHDPQYVHYIPQHAPNGWSSHGVYCGCHGCIAHHDHFFMPHSFGPQSVAG